MGVGLQVSLTQIKEYHGYLKRGYHFEVTDFAYPSNYGIKGERILERWQNFPHKDNITSTHGSYYDLRLHSIDPQIGEITRKRYLWNLGIADQLGAEFTIFHSNYQPTQHSDHYLKRWVDDHERFLRTYGDQYNTKILLENAEDPSPAILEHLLGTDVGICLDIGYIQLHSTVSFEEWFARLGKAIKVIHIKEQIKQGQELPVGTGYIDWDDISNNIATYCNQPALILEMDGLDNITSSLDYIQDHGLFGNI